LNSLRHPATTATTTPSTATSNSSNASAVDPFSFTSSFPLLPNSFAYATAHVDDDIFQQHQKARDIVFNNKFYESARVQHCDGSKFIAHLLDTSSPLKFLFESFPASPFTSSSGLSSVSKQQQQLQLSATVLEEIRVKREVQLESFMGSSGTQQPVFYLDGVRHEVPMTRFYSNNGNENDNEEEHVLADVSGPCFDLQRLQQAFAVVPPSPELKTLVDWIHRRDLAEKLQDSWRQWPQNNKNNNNTVSRLPRNVAMLEENGTIVRVRQQQGGATTSSVLSSASSGPQQQQQQRRATNRQTLVYSPVFTVPKKNPCERRFIFNGVFVNSLIEAAVTNIPTTPLPLIPELFDEMLTYNFISTNDAQSYFYQFAVHQRLSQFLGLRVQRYGSSAIDHYQMAVLPMGLNFSPALAQRMSLYVIELVVRAVRIRHPSIHVKFFVWIDNFILLTQQQQHQVVVQQLFDEVATLFQLRMKGWEGGSQSLEVLGVMVDLQQRTARPSSTAVAALRQRAAAVTAKPPRPSPNQFSSSSSQVVSNTTAAAAGGAATATSNNNNNISSSRKINNTDIMKFFGTVQWIIYSTARIPLCFYPSVMEKLRDVCRQQQWDDETECTVDFFREAVALAESCEHRCRQPRSIVGGLHRGQETWLSSSRRIWTDASSAYLASIEEGSCRAVRVPLHEAGANITVSELLAGYMGFYYFNGDTWVTDNMAAARAVVRGHSGSDACDAILRAWIESGRVPRYVEWVDSECMLADPLTRPHEPWTQRAHRADATHLRWTVRWTKGEEAGATY
jgi:hypothetical protein